jgi:hypothetical protein
MENLEIWVTIAALWVAQIKLLYDMREVKSCIKIKKKAVFK